MGTGAVIIGLSAQALVWALVSAVVLIVVRTVIPVKRVGWVGWALAVVTSAICHGLILFILPWYAESPIGETLTSIRIFLVPLTLLSALLWLAGILQRDTK